MTSAPKSPIQRALDANERNADLAHKNDVLRRQRDFARRLAGAGWIVAGVLAAVLLAGCAKADEGTVTYDMGGSIGAYSAKYHEMDIAGKTWVVPKDCGSSCVLGLRNKKVCYAKDVMFHFHGVSRRGEYDATASAALRDAMPEGVRQWADGAGAFNSTEVVSISGRDLAAYDGRVCS